MLDIMQRGLAALYETPLDHCVTGSPGPVYGFSDSGGELPDTEAWRGFMRFDPESSGRILADHPIHRAGANSVLGQP